MTDFSNGEREWRTYTSSLRSPSAHHQMVGKENTSVVQYLLIIYDGYIQYIFRIGGVVEDV